MVQFQVISWYSGDEGNKYMIHIFGRSDDGKVHHVKFPYKPCLYIRCNHFPVNLREKYAQRFEKVQNMRSVWGYSDQTQVFYKIRFDSLRQRKFAELDLKKTFKIFEANIDPVLRFMHESGVSSTGWVEVPDDMGVVRMHNIKPVPERADIAPIRIMSLDIECYSQSHSFPDPSKANDCVFQIAMTTRTWGRDEPPDECLLCISEYKTEKALLEAFAKKMRQIDPDVITGWNIFGFDLEYLYKRLGMVNCSPMAYHWGRDLEHPVELVEKRLASNALGSNMLKMVPIFGRYVFDLFQEVKREQKFESYSLNHVSKVLLGDSKLDMPIKEMFKRFEEGDLADVGAYCIKDTLLPHRIMDRLCTVPNLIEMAKATWVPLNYLTERGQQIKVFSQISKKAREMGFLIPTMYSKDESDEKYKGATVLEANIGAYYDPVTALDFASLYPSIMMAHNLCYSTILLDGATHPNEELVGEARYVQGVPALLPAVLRELKQFRKQAKKDMANAKGTPMEDVYNAKQLAYKISMNSVYGFTGATKGFLPLVDIASSVTAKGREMIQMTKDIIESEFPGSKVLYGDTDSVMVQFDVGELKGQDAIRESWRLGEIASARVQQSLRDPNELELEKVYCPYFLYSKKRYAAMKWVLEKGELESKVDVKGLQLVRRDTCPYVRGVCKSILDAILQSPDPLPVVRMVRQARADLLEGRVPMEELVLTRSLAAEYKSQNLAHVKVRDKIRERMPGSEPKSGDRIAFVLVKTESPKDKAAYLKAEDPQWAREHGLQLDYEYYFKNHLRKPVSDLLEPLIDPRDLWSLEQH